MLVDKSAQYPPKKSLRAWSMSDFMTCSKCFNI